MSSDEEPLVDDGSIGSVVEVTVYASARCVGKIFTKAMAVSLRRLSGSSEKLTGGSMNGLCPGQYSMGTSDRDTVFHNRLIVRADLTPRCEELNDNWLC